MSVKGWLLALALAAQAPAAAPPDPAIEALRQQLQKVSCPEASDDPEAPLCFVRSGVREGEWAMGLVARERMMDNVAIYRQDGEGWKAIYGHPAPSWEHLQESGVPIPKTVFERLLTKLLPE